jgi:hypothetical protein
MSTLGRVVDKAAQVAVFPLYVGMRLLGVLVHDVLELAEDLRER